MKATYLMSFDAFATNTPETLTEPMGEVTEFFQLFYLAEMKVAVFCAVIAVILVGVYFVLKNKAADLSANKAWAIRIAIVVLLIFSLGNLIGMIWDAGI